MIRIIPTAALSALLLACSSGEVSAPANEVAAAPAATEAAPVPADATTPKWAAAPAAETLTLDGLGDLRIGQPVPAGSGFAAHGAQASDACTTVTSPDFPGVYAIVEDGAVRRISVGQRSDVKLVEGIGVGSTEAAVRAAFPGFGETPHKYVEAPAKYLTAPNADRGQDVALRFEIGADGKVSIMHIGTMPVLGYVEGCS
jgi:hypothetical protein